MNFVLEDSGYTLTSTPQETIEFIVKIAATENEMKPAEIEEWIINHTVKNNPKDYLFN